jgi:hypothetical protein
MVSISVIYQGTHFCTCGGRIEYDEYVKWKTEDDGKYGEKESAFTAAHSEMWTQIRCLPSFRFLCPLIDPSSAAPRDRAEMNRPSGARPLNTTGL